MKYLFSFLLLVFSTFSNADSIAKFCGVDSGTPSPSMSYSSSCTSTCSTIADDPSIVSNMTSGTYGICMGRATVKNTTVKKIALGKTEIGNESECVIWSGDDMVLDFVGGAGLTSATPPSVANCTKGIQYDALYITLGRFDENAGEAVFPDGSGKIVRTTSTYASKDTANPVDVDDLSSWRDLASADSDLAYGIPNTSSPAWIYKKLSSSYSSTDMTSSSNETMIWDNLKANYSTYTNSAGRPGFMCYQRPDGTNLDTNDCVRDNGDDTWTTIVPSGAVSGLPLTLNEGDAVLDFEYVKLKSNRGSGVYQGTQFLWYKDAIAGLQYVGMMPREAEGDYTEFRISNIGPSTFQE